MNKINEIEDWKIAYNKWKRDNVTLRGMKQIGQENGSGAMLGSGLYMAPLSNKALAKQYGEVHYVVNGKPKNPLMFRDLNLWEIWEQNFIYKTLGFKNRTEFNDKTNIATEIKKLGYDGVVIKGREMVNYSPPDNLMYFQNENQLIDYYERRIENVQEVRRFVRKTLKENVENNLNDNFWKWFAGSKVVDASGNPMPIHHGTGKKFSKFSLKNAPQPIIWFTSDKSSLENGEQYTAGGRSHIMDLYASIKNPAGWEEYRKYGLGQIESMGYDGAILPNQDGTFTGFVFDPKQLKSVVNKGEWNPSNKNIYKEEQRIPGQGNYASCHTSDLIRMDKIEEFLKEVEKDPDYNTEVPDYDWLMDPYGGYEQQTYIQNDLSDGKIIFWEGWSSFCWEGLYSKPEYKGLSKEAALKKIFRERTPRIAQEFDMTIEDANFFWHQTSDEMIEDGYIMKIVLKKNKLNEERNGAPDVKTVYHGTSLKKIDNIKSRGLQAGSMGYHSASWYMVSTDFESALFHAVAEDGQQAPVIEFEVPCDNKKWEGHPYFWPPYERSEDSKWFALKEPIPDKFIKKIHYVSYEDFIKRKQEKY